MRKKKTRKKKSPSSLLKMIIPAGIAVLLGINLLFTVPSAKPSLFRGYYTVYYRGEKPLAEIVGPLQRQPDIEAVVSRETAEVLYTNWKDWDRVPLVKMESRFDGSDPRLDDYMKRLGGFFSVEENDGKWDVFFVATRRNPLYLSLLLEQTGVASGRDWFIYEWDRTEATVLIAVTGTVFFFFLMLLSRRRAFHILLAVGVLPWFYALARGGIGDFLLFFFIAYYWAFFLREYLAYSENELLAGWKDADKKPLWLRLGLYSGLILFTFFLTALYKTDLSEITGAVVAQACLLAAHRGVLRGMQSLKKGGKIVFSRRFQPLPILRTLAPRKKIVAASDFVSHALVLLLGLLTLVLLFQPSLRSLRLPLPESITPDQEITLSAIRRLHEAKTQLGFERNAQGSSQALPDLSDFVRHAAYQERLKYGKGASDSFPGKDERIVLSDYQWNASEGSVEQRPREVVLFDDFWLNRIIAMTGKSSIERMLFNQGHCFSISYKSTGERNPFLGYNWTIIIIWGIVLCPIILMQYTALPQYKSGRRDTEVKPKAGVKAKAKAKAKAKVKAKAAVKGKRKKR